MSKIKIMLVSLLSIFFIGSCTSTRTISIKEGTYEGIEVYTTKIPTEKFNEIDIIQVGGGFVGRKGLMDKLVEKAKEEGADGLVNVQYQMFGERLIISGTAIKFEKSN